MSTTFPAADAAAAPQAGHEHDRGALDHDALAVAFAAGVRAPMAAAPSPQPALPLRPTVDADHVRFPSRFAGPAGMANGGWVAGTLSGLLLTGHVSVTLRAPAPLDHDLEVRRADGGVSLWDGGTLVAEGTQKGTVWEPPTRIDPEVARQSSAGFVGHHEHPFPGCFVCGTERGGDALRIFTGPVAGRPALVSGTWTPAEDLAAPDGLVDHRAVWAALDCPTGWSHFVPGGVAVLGQMTGTVRKRPEPGEPCVVVARRGPRDGRKLWATSAVYRADGSLAAGAAALWIDLGGRLPGPPT